MLFRYFAAVFKLPRPLLVLWAGAAVLSTGCGRSALPDPHETLSAYERATAKGDAAALYALLTERSQRALGKQGVERMVADQRAELAAQANALQSGSMHIEAQATVRYPDGEEAILPFENGAFRISSADALPSGANTPAQALEQLRKVLARRSYAGLIRVLSRETQNAIEHDIRALVDGLEQPGGLVVKVQGNNAIVTLPGGHLVHLRREDGAWKVEDFE